MRSIEYIVVARAKQLVEQGWITGGQAVMRNGRPCNPLHPHAAKFCLGGAIVPAAAEILGDASAADISDLTMPTLVAQTRARKLVVAANNIATIELFNDSASKDAVLAACDRALAFEGTVESV
jgi:hypothetical protein